MGAGDFYGISKMDLGPSKPCLRCTTKAFYKVGVGAKSGYTTQPQGNAGISSTCFRIWGSGGRRFESSQPDSWKVGVILTASSRAFLAQIDLHSSRAGPPDRQQLWEVGDAHAAAVEIAGAGVAPLPCACPISLVPCRYLFNLAITPRGAVICSSVLSCDPVWHNGGGVGGVKGARA